jgi:hypothetical protein
MVGALFLPRFNQSAELLCREVRKETCCVSLPTYCGSLLRIRKHTGWLNALWTAFLRLKSASSQGRSLARCKNKIVTTTSSITSDFCRELPIRSEPLLRFVGTLRDLFAGVKKRAEKHILWIPLWLVDLPLSLTRGKEISHKVRTEHTEYSPSHLAAFTHFSQLRFSLIVGHLSASAGY